MPNPSEGILGEEKFQNNENETKAITALLTRAACYNRANSYYNFSWTCTNTNLSALTNWTKPHYITGAGTYWSMPYCWGGFHNPTQYTTGLANGGRVGNVNTSNAGYISNTYGIDCSGLVSRAWSKTTKYNVTGLVNCSTQIAWESIGLADAIVLPAHHIRLMLYKGNNGAYVCYESTVSNQLDRVACTSYSLEALVQGGYLPYHYNSLID